MVVAREVSSEIVAAFPEPLRGEPRPRYMRLATTSGGPSTTAERARGPLDLTHLSRTGDLPLRRPTDELRRSGSHEVEPALDGHRTLTGNGPTPVPAPGKAGVKACC